MCHLQFKVQEIGLFQEELHLNPMLKKNDENVEYKRIYAVECFSFLDFVISDADESARCKEVSLYNSMIIAF